MQIATSKSKKISPKQLRTMGIIFGVLVAIGVAVGLFLLTQGAGTQASEEMPQSVETMEIDASKVSVSWSTGKETIAVIEYGTEADAASFADFAFSENPTTSHNVEIPSLEPETTYYFQIRSGDSVFDNGGLFWSFTTPPGDANPETTPGLSPTAILSPVSITPSISISPVASPSASIIPTPSLTATPSGALQQINTPTASPSGEVSPSPTGVAICSSTNCTNILQSLGNLCTTQDYVKCLLGANVTVTEGPTGTATPAPVSEEMRSTCAITSLQSNSCSSWIWEDMTAKELSCSETFTKYFVQCKGTSWSSSDPAPWYCNKTTSSNSLSLPCDNAPTPAPGQAVFCRVRAETEAGGDDNATDWVYINSTCSSYGVLASAANCQIDYLQQSLCGSWSWSLANFKDPTCTAALDHYWLQCTSNGLFSNPTDPLTPTPYWYCNTTTEESSLDMPCGNAFAPADGQTLTCRVRPEDAYGTNAHAGEWKTQTLTCPTSTPTPTDAPTATTAPTATPTP